MKIDYNFIRDNMVEASITKNDIINSVSVLIYLILIIIIINIIK